MRGHPLPRDLCVRMGTALGLPRRGAGAFVCRPARESGGGGGEHPSGELQARFCPVSSRLRAARPRRATRCTRSCRSRAVRRGCALCVARRAARARGLGVSGSGGSWVLAQEQVSVRGPPGWSLGMGGDRAGCCGASLRVGGGGCAGSCPQPSLPGAAGLPPSHAGQDPGPRARRVAARPRFAPCRVSWAWGAPCVLSATLLLPCSGCPQGHP